jgi:molybdopterin-guanine dinucleotide biosynthesis protein
VRDLMTHAYVVGPSGTGKTTMLVRLVLELAAQRTAAVVLDPHGDLTRHVLAGLPDDVADRVRLFDITDPASLPTINPLWLPPQPDESAAAVARAVRSAAVTAVFADLWRLDKASAPNLMHFLEAALAALVATGDGCLADLPRFLTDGTFRTEVVNRANDARIDARWREFAALAPDDRSRTVRAILNKAADFDRNPILATIFGDPGPGLRLDDVMDHGGLLLVNLPRGLVPEGTVELVGSLLVTQLYQAALAREARPPDERPPVVAVIDEFQEFALSTFAKVVTATRKYGLGLVVANQNLSRLHAVGPDVLSTLLANVGTLVAFRTGSADAEYLAPLFDPFDAADLRVQAAHECYWRLTLDGTPQPVVSARSLPPATPARVGVELDRFAEAVRLAGRPLVLSQHAPTEDVFQ